MATLRSMIQRALLAAAAAFALTPVAYALADKPVTEAELAAHIDVLASDAFQGRAPGTEGEYRTIAYVTGEWARAGLIPVPGSTTPWLQPVPLVETKNLGGSATFRRDGRPITLEDDSILLTSRAARAELKNLPVLFVGYGVDASGKVTADVRGKVAVMLFDNVPYGTNLPRFRDRRRMLAEAGASAVLIVAGEALPWAQLKSALGGSTTTRATNAASGPEVSGFLAPAAFDNLVTRAGATADELRTAAKNPDFAARDLGISVDLTASSSIRAFDSHNIIAKLPGAKPDGKAIVIMGHWDHLGICRPEGAADRICNGAVDNASGIAVMIEVAQRLGQSARPDRDIYFLATTAEESGLLGAYHFADNPVVPLGDITVALNIDTIAIAPRGTPVATIGRGSAPHDAVVAEVATKLGRKIDTDGEADAFVQRQDGWAFGAKGVVSLMTGGSFSDMALLQAFLGSDYHGPADQPGQPYPLGGAAEDADLHVALARAFGSTKRWAGKPLP
ncbi:MAG: M28 family peptidase [Sphingopyxis sp.]|nr:M28 family peptidase [Sphingopyxis sp.]